jgi:hypothetical protein
MKLMLLKGIDGNLWTTLDTQILNAFRPRKVPENEMMRLSILAMAMLVLTGFMPVATVGAAIQNVNFSHTATFDHVKITVSGTITVDTTAKTVTGTISLTVTNTTTGQIIFTRTFNINLFFGSSNSANFVLSIPFIPSTLATSCNVTTGSTSSCLVSKTPDFLHHGVVDIADAAALAYAFGTVQGDANYNPAADLNGDGRIDIQDAALLAFDFGAPVY